MNAFVAVPGENRTLFHCVFRPRYYIRSTVAQYFHLRSLLDKAGIDTSIVKAHSTRSAAALATAYACITTGDIKGGAYTCTWYVDLAGIDAALLPTLNGNTALQCFECGSTVKIPNVIMFDFYPGLPHIYMNAINTILVVIREFIMYIYVYI